MPRIPSYQSETGIKVTASPEMGTGAISKSEQAQKGVTGAIENVEDTIVKIRDFRQANEASIYQLQRSKDLETQLKQDPDIDPDKYASELDKITSEASSTISGQLAKEEFMAKAKQHNIVFNYGVKDAYRTQQIEGAKSIVLLKGEQLANNYGDMSDVQKHAAVVDYKSSLEDAIKKGVYNQAEATLVWDKTKEKIGKITLDTDVAKDNATNIDESYVYNQLKLGKDGEYADISSKERAEALDNIQKKVRRNQLLFTFQQNQDQDKNEAQMLVDSVDGKLTPEVVKNNLLNQGVRRPFGEKMLKKIYDNPNPDTDYSAYNKIRELQMTDAPAREINQEILNNSDKLNNADKKFLIDKTFSEVDKKQKTIIRYNANALKNWAKDNLSLMPELQNDLVYEFHRRVNQSNAQGSAIDAIAQDLQKEKIKEIYPSTALMNDVPNFVADRNKLRKVYEKESKIKSKSRVNAKPVNTVTGGVGINFDDL